MSREQQTTPTDLSRCLLPSMELSSVARLTYSPSPLKPGHHPAALLPPYCYLVTTIDGRGRCARENCDTRATFGDPATGRREFCSKHAPAGMHNVERKKCARQGCPLPPAYGDPMNRKRR